MILSKASAAALKFLMRGTSGDKKREPRSILETLSFLGVFDKFLASSNGYVIHVVKKDAVQGAEDLKPGTAEVKGKIGPGSAVYLRQVAEGEDKYPDVRQIIPGKDRRVFAVVLQAELLQNALAGMTGPVAMCFQSAVENGALTGRPDPLAAIEFSGSLKNTTGGDVPVYALIVPMYGYGSDISKDFYVPEVE